MSWRSTDIGQVLDESSGEIQTGPFGTQLKASDYQEDGTPVINVRNIGYGDLRPEKLEFVGESKADKLKVHRLEKDDIVFGRKGAVDRHLLVAERQVGWIQGSDCIRLRLDPEVVLPKFVSYALLRETHKKWILSQSGNKATMASLNHDIIRRIPISLPDLPTQQRIAGILSAYDDLIETNRRRILLLEQAARLLYREWFVHLRFPGHETAKIVDGLPEGWEKTTVGAHCPLIYGKALKAETRIEGPFDVYGSSGIVGTHNKALTAGPAIIVGRKGNVGSVFWARRGFWPIDTVYFVDPANSDFFTYHALRQITFQSTDVAVPGLNRDYAHSREIRLPTKGLVQSFNDRASVFLRQAELLSSQNDALTRARDLLLPRLMDGRLPV